MSGKVGKLNLVVPEDTEVIKGYRPDFLLYFKGEDTGYPVEIKWKAADFSKPNQVSALADNNGFLVAFDKPKD